MSPYYSVTKGTKFHCQKGNLEPQINDIEMEILHSAGKKGKPWTKEISINEHLLLIHLQLKNSIQIIVLKIGCVQLHIFDTPLHLWLYIISNTKIL
jgi:hypothetical protein